jgi:peptide/nickel transport system permease protein
MDNKVIESNIDNVVVQVGTQKIKKRSQLAEVWRRFRRNKSALVGMTMFLILVFAAIFADVISPYDPLEQNYSIRLQPPSAEHWFGTDELGRDILSRIIYGARISLTVGLIAVSVSCAAGCALGAIAGYYGGKFDNIIMRFIDIIMAIPAILLNISIVAALGNGLQNVMIAIGISSVAGYCRIMRASVLSIKEQEFVEASRAAGASDFYIIMQHILPNSLAPLIIQATLRLGGAILSCASMSFIGLGIIPPTPEWGAMLSTGRDFLRNAPHVTTFPGIAIMYAVFAMNLMGDGLRDALDPKLKD